MNAREVALAVIRDVFEKFTRRRHSAQESLNYHLLRASLEPRDRAFATELAYGAIKMRRTVEWYLRPYLSDRTRTLPAIIMEILRLGVYEIQFMDFRAHATVSESVNLAKKYGHAGTAGLVNAVLRRILRERPEPPQRAAFEDENDYLATRYSFPTWMVERWRAQFPAASIQDMLQGMNLPARAAVRVNLLRTSIDAVMTELQIVGVVVQRSEFVPEVLVVQAGLVPQECEEKAQGRWSLQSEAAAMPVDILNPQPGEAVLDLCSGRGNKAVQIASRMQNEGFLLCVEQSKAKENTLRRRLAEAGAFGAQSRATDARELDEGEQFDRILLDPPCSSLGILARHPEARWRKSPGDAGAHAEIQRSMLHAAAKRLLPGGALVYAVCSTDILETNDVVDEFVRTQGLHRGLIPRAYESLQTERGDVLVPPGLQGRDGFFIARMDRTA